MKARYLLPTLALLSACTTVGPDYSLPKESALRKPAAGAPFISPHGSEIASAPVPANWWKLYRDPQLDRLIDQALAANTELRIAAANLRKARALEVAADAGRLPRAGAGAGVHRAQEMAGPFRSSKLPVANEADVGISVSYEVDLFGRLAREEEFARANTEASAAGLDLVRVAVVAETARAYVQGCSAGHQSSVARRDLALQQQSMDIARRLLHAGRGWLVDVELAQARVTSVQSYLASLQAQQDGQRYRLAALLGKVPSELAPDNIACTMEPTLAEALPVGDGAALLQRRPDVRQAERLLAAATARIGIATAELYPSITLGASAGLGGALDDLGKGRAVHWGLGPLISWTIPDSGSRARIKASEADAEALLARFDGVVLNALRETETALTLYAKELERNALLRAARDNARVAAGYSRRLYQAGRAPYVSTVDTDLTLASYEASVANSDAQLALDQVNLFLALGGGWQRRDE